MHAATSIRQANLNDADAIAALVNEAYTPYIARIGKQPAPMLDDYRQVISEAEVFVLTQEAGTVGVLVMNQEGNELLLVNVAVSARCKGKGFGKVLMQYCEDYARRARCTAIRLYTHELMSENIAIYKKLGYQETHRATENGFARVFMRKALQEG
ncbi:GNAT family N-acetyltransferase [Pseudomonas alkylphenolica]|uniref:GNAT family N-acetyltransferase n=1 Tax=Pseudomonas alkylphenolica TaxID=237609 RepID=UPI001F4F4D2C|nr:GNAT family N-acetyltransferase [Pseudomonas alkylphenolica]